MIHLLTLTGSFDLSSLKIPKACHTKEGGTSHHRGWGGVGDQAYSRLSTTRGHITDCKLDSVVYAVVCVVI